MTTLGTASDMAGRDAHDARGIVALARRAPSVFNTQPWRWRVDGDVLELRADRDRQLPVSDPCGRNLMISCGAALHHSLVAAAGLGRSATVDRFPTATDPDLLATVRLGEPTAVTARHKDELDALGKRQTDRRRFTSWPVPEERLGILARGTRGGQARVLPLKGAEPCAIAECLVERAIDVQGMKPAYLREQTAWIARAGDDGMPAATLPRRHRSQPRSRFDSEPAPTSGYADGSRVTASDRLLVIGTARDDVASWLDAGETLSALWLRATLMGLSVVPLSQVVEVEETRAALRSGILAGMAYPQVLARIGWLQITRAPLVPTPRRPVADVAEWLRGTD